MLLLIVCVHFGNRVKTYKQKVVKKICEVWVGPPEICLAKEMQHIIFCMPAIPAILTRYDRHFSRFRKSMSLACWSLIVIKKTAVYS